MVEIIILFFAAMFFYNRLASLVQRGQMVVIGLWPFDKQKTKKVLYRIFIGFLIYLTFSAFLSAILNLLGIDL